MAGPFRRVSLSGAHTHGRPFIRWFMHVVAYMVVQVSVYSFCAWSVSGALTHCFRFYSFFPDPCRAFVCVVDEV